MELPTPEAVEIAARTPYCEDLVRVVNGMGIFAAPRIFTTAVLIGTPGSPVYDDTWCYHTREAALAAIAGWDIEGGMVEPEGWHRHNRTGRRRPDGDPAREYVSP